MQPDERASTSQPTGESDIARLQRMILAFAAARDWQQFHDPKNLAMAVAVEAGELMDHFRWVTNDRALTALDDPRTRAGVEEEAADVAILLFEFAAVCGIDLAQAIERKLARNAERYPVELSRGRADKHDRLR
ncbi:MAG: nucleotide pyrophosphohydrolase [bacterium]